MNRRARPGVIVLIVAVAVLFQRWSLDGVQGLLLSALFRDDTVYAHGYSDRAFRAIRRGMSEQQVIEMLGEPLVVGWSYNSSHPAGCVLIHFVDRKAHSWVYDDTCVKMGVRRGLSPDEVRRLLGTPYETTWIYSRSPGDTHYRERVVNFSNARVTEVHAEFYLD